MATNPVRRIRKSFAKVKPVIEIPPLIELQKRSFSQFLQKETRSAERQDIGLQGVFKSVFPIKGFNQTASLEFVGYEIDAPKYDEQECRNRGMTYAAPMRVLVRLIVWDVDENTGAQSIRDVKEQEVYFGEVPVMTEFGTFIVNGTERVIVSQLHRSPGVFFEHDKGKTHASGKLLFSARMIPYRGAWLDFEFDSKDLLYVRIDRRRKIPATILLRSIGYTPEELLNMFYTAEKITLEGSKISKTPVLELLPYQRPSKDMKHPKTGEVFVKKGKKFRKPIIDEIRKLKDFRIPLEFEDIDGKVVAHDIVDPKTGEVVLATNEVMTEAAFEAIQKRKITTFELLYIDELNVGSYLRNTLLSDKVTSQEEARIEIYKRLRPGDPATPEASNTFFENLFFNPERYDLSKVGRLKLNYKFRLDIPLEVGTLRKEDIVETVRYLLKLKDGEGEIDDIDHLGNRRVRLVGELLENQYRVGLVRMERAIKERMSLQDVETLMPHDLINSKPVSAVIKEFFGSSQLSQFMDQTNPLSEVTHKRRLSALGPGGLTRERAGFEVRDVHTTHYGRICPIETPEGPNIGLIASLSVYARINDFGFIETPYRKVMKGRATDEVVYCSALEESAQVIAQANAKLDKNGNILTEQVQSRVHGEFVLADRDQVTLMDVAPQQLVSVAAALIPFLEHDDANRALMGSNMQRQAVPLIRTTAPLVGTGLELVLARDSGVTAVAKRDGIVTEVDANRIVIRAEKGSKGEFSSDVDIYNLIKYQRSNQSTCITQKPIVKKGDRIKRGDVVADGPATDQGELALGQNVLVAFMPWAGYNFEDSILISERMLKEDYFTSIHIEEFECAARDTKLGKEEITRDIPNVGEEALKDLDESGIIRIGAEVKPGDILIGKVTPKGETQLSPEERLLRAIFGEKAGDVKDTSLRVPPGVSGIVISAQVFSREGIDLDERAKEIQGEEADRIKKDLNAELKGIYESAAKRIEQVLKGSKLTSKVEGTKGDVVFSKGDAVTAEGLMHVPFEDWSDLSTDADDAIETHFSEMLERAAEQADLIRMMYDQKLGRLSKGDELPPGVIKMVKVYVAIKRKLAVGDKMAGRHGNKGVISRIVAEEDLPYTADGRPVDLVLNPLGVPSRMNVGQILETHLGWAAYGLGEEIQRLLEQDQSVEDLKKRLKKIYNSPSVDEYLEKAKKEEIVELCRQLQVGVPVETRVFDGATEVEVKELLDEAGLSRSGQTILFDGRTGEAFDTSVTIGVMYMLKLHHLVDEKIHARSIGPYSLVTQQPLGGKAQFGGQRLGEMEVWAMEAYGAAYALQEFLTVKSDDVVGRTRMYEAIVKGEKSLEPGLPESFHVLMKELQALCLDIELIEAEAS
ncbi:MAG: DNA-directed RNA polymerase subunit beta [Deltaproteobacteria bacterium RIFCSPLOWO2_02_FULL_44_10]|nr:MAG: DNA-directed RNA polymerase subunit beta [Deltaproteobacteria bacterium RIFCSPHIGHO2_02_FULL_44_16]OGQ45116.1 MAG: DNA-directed RNA polymerase subunit beta [Deltaproteobacteria bacterium RIFCSPLOWO2_02_FULL_44_10]